jgi:hypothetical protein
LKDPTTGADAVPESGVPGSYVLRRAKPLRWSVVGRTALFMTVFIAFEAITWRMLWRSAFESPALTLDEFGLAVALLGVMVLLADAVTAKVDEFVRWRNGGAAEQRVAAALRPLLEAGWILRLDVDKGADGNVDHVAIGPRGVFAIETKAKSRPWSSDLRQARMNAAWVKRRADVRWAMAVVVATR